MHINLGEIRREHRLYMQPGEFMSTGASLYAAGRGFICRQPPGCILTPSPSARPDACGGVGCPAGCRDCGVLRPTRVGYACKNPGASWIWTEQGRLVPGREAVPADKQVEYQRVNRTGVARWTGSKNFSADSGGFFPSSVGARRFQLTSSTCGLSQTSTYLGPVL